MAKKTDSDNDTVFATQFNELKKKYPMRRCSDGTVSMNL